LSSSYSSTTYLDFWSISWFSRIERHTKKRWKKERVRDIKSEKGFIIKSVGQRDGQNWMIAWKERARERKKFLTYIEIEILSLFSRVLEK
jgi:hypothetical protein